MIILIELSLPPTLTLFTAPEALVVLACYEYLINDLAKYKFLITLTYDEFYTYDLRYHL